MDATAEPKATAPKPGPKKRQVIVQTYWTEEEAEILRKAAAGVPLGRWVRNFVISQLTKGRDARTQD